MPKVTNRNERKNLTQRTQGFRILCALYVDLYVKKINL